RATATCAGSTCRRTTPASRCARTSTCRTMPPDRRAPASGTSSSPTPRATPSPRPPSGGWAREPEPPMTTAQRPSADDPRVFLDEEAGGGVFEPVPPYPPRTEREAEFYTLGDGEMFLNMGPQHPSTHGVLRVVLKLDGE